MRRNIGGLDRCVRLMVGCALLPLGLLVLGGLRGETLGLVVAAIGVLLLATGLIRFCPLYVPFGISTAREGHWRGQMFAHSGRGAERIGGMPRCCGSKSGEPGSASSATVLTELKPLRGASAEECAGSGIRTRMEFPRQTTRYEGV